MVVLVCEIHDRRLSMSKYLFMLVLNKELYILMDALQKRACGHNFLLDRSPHL